MREVARRFAFPLALILLGGFLHLYTQSLTTMRFPKAEAAAYLFLGIGLLSLPVAVFQQLTYVKPIVGCHVEFWGPDGKTKLSGPIVARDGDRYSVETSAGKFTVQAANFTRVRRPDPR
ncbi:MAG: hypothetical protein MUE69_23115 [Myxococcota bacterium]|jgi:hypothetical protein|nr:hypothetical protein [Myxococcota bacterium]